MAVSASFINHTFKDRYPHSVEKCYQFEQNNIKKIIALHCPLCNPGKKSDEKLNELRCPKCNSLLLKHAILGGVLQIKCKCGTVNRIEVDLKIKPEGPLTIFET
jgi:phage FluMu protein Com